MRDSGRVLGQQGIARARRNDNEVRLHARFADRERGALAGGIDLIHARTDDAATRRLRAFEKKSIQHRSRIDDDGLIERQVRAMALAGNQLHVADQFFGIGTVKKEGIGLDGFVRQPAAARFFPGQMLIINRDAVSRARQPLSAHGPGRAATHDRNFTHRNASMKRAEPGMGPGAGKKGSIMRGNVLAA